MPKKNWCIILLRGRPLIIVEGEKSEMSFVGLLQNMTLVHYLLSVLQMNKFEQCSNLGGWVGQKGMLVRIEKWKISVHFKINVFTESIRTLFEFWNWYMEKIDAPLTPNDV